MASTCFHVIKTVMGLFMLILLCFITISDCKEVRGYLGGEVAFHCPIDEHRKMVFLYLQKGTIFVNGYYVDEDIEEHNPWRNSRLDRQRNIVYLSGLNISHSGVYTCHFQYEDSSNMEDQHINLTVSANYSEPSVQPIDCPDEHSECSVQCSSYGGYPKAELQWSLRGVEESPGARTWRKLNSMEVPDNVTQLFNLSSVAVFNCSTGEPLNISCSVLGIVTNLSICKKEGAPNKPSHVNRTAIICPIVVIVLIFVIVLGCILKEKIKKMLGVNNGVI